jgi:NAD(P)-dependent dehydrogenase (short-subunit alcohol dehydrogenase family)
MDVLESFSLDGKVAVITGAAGSIGSEYSKAMAEAGADVAIVDKEKEKLEELASQIRSDGTDILQIQADVRDEGEVQRVFDTTFEQLGSVDIVITCAGIFNMGGSIPNYDMNKWDSLLDVNLRGVFLTNLYASRTMLEHDIEGSIINTSSILTNVASDWPGIVGYCVASSGIAQITRQMAAELGPYGIRVNTIALGWFNAGVTTTIFETADNTDKLRDDRAKYTSLKRIGETGEVKGLAVYLASDAASYCTGETINLDGGWVAYI